MAIGKDEIRWNENSIINRHDTSASFSTRTVGVILRRRDTVAIVTPLCFPRHCSLITTGCYEVSISAVHLNPSTSPNSLLALVLTPSNYPTVSFLIIF